MLNEEDHLRIQGLLPGMQLERSAELAFSADDALGAQNVYAFDPQWGYLTSCPTNVGTGMRASAMLHLPAITQNGQIGAIMQAVAKLGLTVRGLYGEGSEAQGDLYQLSNQVTLGRARKTSYAPCRRRRSRSSAMSAPCANARKKRICTPCRISFCAPGAKR